MDFAGPATGRSINSGRLCMSNKRLPQTACKQMGAGKGSNTRDIQFITMVLSVIRLCRIANRRCFSGRLLRCYQLLDAKRMAHVIKKMLKPDFNCNKGNSHFWPSYPPTKSPVTTAFTGLQGLRYVYLQIGSEEPLVFTNQLWFPQMLQHFHKITAHHTSCLKTYLFAIRGFMPVRKGHTGRGFVSIFI